MILFQNVIVIVVAFGGAAASPESLRGLKSSAPSPQLQLQLAPWDVEALKVPTRSYFDSHLL
jgi:hypothetical protein